MHDTATCRLSGNQSMVPATVSAYLSHDIQTVWRAVITPATAYPVDQYRKALCDCPERRMRWNDTPRQSDVHRH